MNTPLDTLQTLMSSPAIVRLGWALVHFTWQGTALAGLLATLLIVLQRRSANARYMACTTVMMGMAAALPATWLLLPANAPSAAALAEKAPAKADAFEHAPAEALPIITAPLESGTSTPAPSPPVMPPSLVEDGSGAERTPAQWWRAAALDRVEASMPWMVAAWFVGVILLSFRLAAGWMIVQRMRHRCVEPVGDAMRGTAQALARRLRVRRSVRVVNSALAQVPSTVGWLRPIILLPASAVTGLTPDQLSALIAHELAHVRRHDYLVNLLQSAIETLLFYHPAVWWVSHRMRVEREHCCDDLAVAVCGDPLVYARALSQMESSRRAPRLLAAASGGSLLNRVRRILGISTPHDNAFARSASGVLVVLGVMALAVVVELSAASASAETAEPASTSATVDTPQTPPSMDAVEAVERSWQKAAAHEQVLRAASPSASDSERPENTAASASMTVMMPATQPSPRGMAGVYDVTGAVARPARSDDPGSQPAVPSDLKITAKLIEDPQHPDGRWLQLHISDFESQVSDVWPTLTPSDELFARFQPFFEGTPTRAFDPMSAFDTPKSRAHTATAMAMPYHGKVIYLPAKNIFYVAGRNTLSSRSDEPTKMFGPFPADALKQFDWPLSSKVRPTTMPGRASAPPPERGEQHGPQQTVPPPTEIKARVIPAPEGREGRWLELFVPDLESHIADDEYERHAPLLEGKSLGERGPASASHVLNASVRSAKASYYYGKLLYLSGAGSFYFHGRLNPARTPNAQAHFYGPFSADALKPLPISDYLLAPLGTQPEPGTETALVQNAIQFVFDVRQGHFEDAAQQFNRSLSKRWSPDRLAEFWQTLQRAGGEFEGIGQVVIEPGDPLTRVAAVRCRWQQNELDLLVAFDGDGRIDSVRPRRLSTDEHVSPRERPQPHIEVETRTPHTGSSTQPAAAPPAEQPALMPLNPSSRPADGEGEGGPSGTVLQPDGSPAAGAAVLLVRESGPAFAYDLQIRDGEVQDARNSLVTHADERGRFKFASHDGPFRLAALTETGLVCSDNTPRSPCKLRIESWCTIKGRIEISNQDNAGQEVHAIPVVDGILDGVSIDIQSHAMADENGRFTLRHVPAGEVIVGLIVTKARGKSWLGQYDHTRSIHVRPDRQEHITLGGTGRSIVGRLRVEGYDGPIEDLFIWGSVRYQSERGILRRLFGGDSRSKETNCALHFRPDGSFYANDLPPGKYNLTARVHETSRGPDWGLGEHVAQVRRTIEIPPNVQQEPFDVGIIVANKP